MPRRRSLLLGAGASLLALAGCAPKRTPLIGFVANVAAEATEGPYFDGLRVGLREHGLIEGETVHIEWRFGGGSNDRVPALVAELLSRCVDLIVASGGATPFVLEADPSCADRRDQRRGHGRARHGASLTRPGGNLTGIQSPVELSSKGFELLHQIVPTARKAAHFFTSAVIGSRVAVNDVVQRLGVELFEQEIQLQAELE